jgi:nitrite reductase (NADH) small subunit/3-phenylpropionate/trans-cinnamate dioxygenase ferredoxin subunit
MSWLTNRLARLIAERGQTVEHTARQLGIERSRLTNIISGTAIPNENLTRRLAKFFVEDPDQWVANATRREDCTPMPEMLLDFIKVARVSDVREGAMKIVCNDLAVVANVQGRFHAFGNVCPHAAGPLGEGFLEGHIVECPWHAAQWNVASGAPVSGLATVDIPVFKVRVVGEHVEIQLTADVLKATAIGTGPG